MPGHFAAFVKRLRSASISIGQLTFGSFVLVLVVIVAISLTSANAIRHLNVTFAELQRLQRVGELAEEIERRLSELRLAARDYVIDPGAPPVKTWDSATALAQLLERTRLELVPEQRAIIDAIATRLTNYREGFERIMVLTVRRAELIAALPTLSQQIEAGIAATPGQMVDAAIIRVQGRIAAALQARDMEGAAAAARDLRALAVEPPALRAAIAAFADGLESLSATEREIADIDRNVLGREGRQIGQVTEVLRDVSARRGQALSGDFAATLASAGWQTIGMGLGCVLIGLSAAVFMVRRTVRPLGEIAGAIRALAAGARDTAIPGVDVRNEIGDIARAAAVFRQTLLDADEAREAAVRALAEQRLAEESYSKLFEDSVEGIYVTTPGGRVLNANPALARMMGYDSPQDLIARANDIAHTIYVDPNQRDDYARRMARDGMVREFEYQVRKRGGGIAWLSDSATAIRNEAGEVVRYEGMVRDITEQKNAEAALAESRRQLQEVIDAVPAVINVKDTNLRYVLMNRYMAGIFDIEPEEAIGHTTTELMGSYGGSKADTNDRRVLEVGHELGFYEEAYADSTGALRHWMANKVPLRDADGAIKYIVTVALDIGERKRTELAMRGAKETAEAAFRNLRDTQNSLIEAEKLAALGRLVAGVAHEVNNPVGISLTVASSLQRRYSLFADEVARGELRRSSLNEFLQQNHDAVSQLIANLNRAADLIQSFKQVAVDRNFSDRRSFNLGDLTEQLVTSLRPGIRKPNLALAVDRGPDLTMNSYPGPFGQVLTNLVVNAVTHAFPGGRDGEIDIRIRQFGDDHAEILFTDNGCGMSPEVRRHAFDPFFTTRRDQGGTGLGLHIVHNIVTNRLGGRINLTSEPEKGSQVQIVLPLIAPLDDAAS